MSKQFTWIVTEIDLEAIDFVLTQAGSVDKFLGTNLDELVPLASLAMSKMPTGTKTLFCYLVPRDLPQKIVVERHSLVKTQVNVVVSHLIECWRPYHIGDQIKEGRVYYENRVLVDGAFVPKDKDFCEWADGVMKLIRKNLRYDASLKAYLGKDADRKIAANALDKGGDRWGQTPFNQLK